MTQAPYQARLELVRRVERLRPAEIARLLDPLPYLQAAELLTLITDPIAADTLEAMSRERQKQVSSTRRSLPMSERCVRDHAQAISQQSMQ